MLILVPIILILWTLGWSLRARLIAPMPDVETGLGAGQLSLIIPARNEAHNLPQLLASIAAQPGAPLEVIVVDDGSTDDTAAIAAQAGARVITSEPLPAGWRGKTWACHQGAAAARGGFLCFLDADTWFAGGGLERMLEFHQGGVLSIGPWHAMNKPYEWLSLFFNLAMVAGTVPRGLFGQSMLVEADAYRRVGGHQAVKSQVLENVHLQSHFAKAGIPSRSLPGRGILHFRMYPGGIGELIEGWTKGFASGAGRTSRATLVTLVLWMIGLMGTFLALVLHPQTVIWGLLYLFHALQVALLARKVGSFPWGVGLLYPLPLLFFFILFGRSLRKGGRDVSWKGRAIDQP